MKTQIALALIGSLGFQLLIPLSRVMAVDSQLAHSAKKTLPSLEKPVIST